MIKFLKSFFGKKDEPAAPYKVEAPANTYEDLKPAKVEVKAEEPQAVAVDVPAKKPAAKKQNFSKKPRATAKPKTATAPKAKAPKAPKAPK